MDNQKKQVDDHHCSVIERKTVEKELKQCDANFENADDRRECKEKVKKFSKKREQACKYS